MQRGSAIIDPNGIAGIAECGKILFKLFHEWTTGKAVCSYTSFEGFENLFFDLLVLGFQVKTRLFFPCLLKYD
jgi:hypothetical protein